MKSLFNIWNYLVGLSPAKRDIALMVGIILVTSLIAYKQYSKNELTHKEIQYQYKAQLDSCRIDNDLLLLSRDSVIKALYDNKLETVNAKLKVAESLLNASERKVKQIKTSINKIEKSIK